MRRSISFFWMAGIPLFTFGCAPELVPPEADVLGTIVGAASESPPEPGASGAAQPDAPTVPSGNASFSVSGSLSGAGAYELFELGGSAAGDVWSVSAADIFAPPAPMAVVLFDADFGLLMRRVVTATSPLRHTMREASPQVYLGVALPNGGGGGAYRYAVKRVGGHPIPGPRRQVVWLDFGPAGAVRVHNRSGISFAAFAGAMLGEQYADHTETIKRAIVQAMREDYARYDVVILSSDDGPPPAEPYATIHFGSEDAGLLGLADNVDNYNEDQGQNAIIFVGTFARFATMRLEPEEMALMVANVASHELGHLLGLYHTRDPDDLMDTTGSAWDLADDQAFARAELDATVFPTGSENSPRLLEQTVGLRPGGAALDLPPSAAKIARRAKVRALLGEQIRWMCGTCQHLDDY